MSKRVLWTVARLRTRPGTQAPILSPAPPRTSCKEKHLRRCRVLPRHPGQSSKRRKRTRTPSSWWPCSWVVLGCGTHQGHGNGVDEQWETRQKTQTRTRAAGLGLARRAQPSDAAPAGRPATFLLIGAWVMRFIRPSSSSSQTTERPIGRLFKLRPQTPEVS